jgi:hypothetical protein
MTKHLLAGVTAVVVIAGVASARPIRLRHPRQPGVLIAPPPGTPVPEIPPPVSSSSTSTTTTVAPTPDGGLSRGNDQTNR